MARRSKAADEAWETMYALDAAARFAAHLRAGGPLQPLPCSIQLDAGEVCYAETAATVWQYRSLGTLNWWAMLPSFSNDPWQRVIIQQRQLQAVQDATEQWRPSGPVVLVATPWRLLYRDSGTWGYIDYREIRDLRPEPSRLLLEIVIDGWPPTTLAGPWVPWLSVLLVYLLTGQVLSLVPAPPAQAGGWGTTSVGR